MLIFQDWVKKQDEFRKEMVIVDEQIKGLNQQLTDLKSKRDSFESQIGDVLKQVGEEKAKINAAIANLNNSFDGICSFEFEENKIMVAGDDAIVDAYSYSDSQKCFIQDETVACCNFIDRNKRIAYCKKIDVIYSELDKI